MKKDRPVEYRTFACEARAVGDAESTTLRVEGRAIPFNSPADIGGMFTEIIAEGAVTKTLREQDQVALSDHNTGLVLGRRSAGTLQLEEDQNGVGFGIDLDPEISHQRDAFLMAKRGDFGGVSHGFRVIRELWDESTKPETRTILEMRLDEISLVAFPAFPTTTVNASEARAIMDRAKAEATVTSAPLQAEHPDADDEQAQRTLGLKIKQKIAVIRARNADRRKDRT